jgi:putative DNA methylase
MEGQEANWDADTRWAVVWFDQYAFGNGDFGQADQLARAKNTAVHGVVEAGVAVSSAGSVRLYKPEELPGDWAPETDKRLTAWEMLHHLIRLLKNGEMPAAAMLARLGDKAEAAKELAYRLYGICEKKKRSTEGQLYNDLISVWPDLLNQSKQVPAPTARAGEFELDA